MSDLIDRQQAIDALREKVFHNLTDEFYGAMQVMDELPSVQPMRKKGRWIDTGSMEEWWAKEFKCSECGESMLGTANYCHNCGADMRGETDG